MLLESHLGCLLALMLQIYFQKVTQRRAISINA